MVEKIKQALERAYNERYNRSRPSHGGSGIDHHSQPGQNFAGKENFGTVMIAKLFPDMFVDKPVVGHRRLPGYATD